MKKKLSLLMRTSPCSKTTRSFGNLYLNRKVLITLCFSRLSFSCKITLITRTTNRINTGKGNLTF